MKLYFYVFCVVWFCADIAIAENSFFKSAPAKLAISLQDSQFKLAADISVKGNMKSHFRKGMKLFMKDEYDKAAPELIASTMIVDPFTWDYWYAEAYATLGVIYEFHNHKPNHNKLAYQYYLLALKRDSKTKSANYYINRVKSKNKIKAVQSASFCTVISSNGKGV